MDARSRMPDLEPDEVATDRLLAAVPRAALPVGFRDAVMSALAGERSAPAWEWIVALVLALPSLGYLGWELAVHGADFAQALANVAAYSQDAGSSETFFFVDGLAVFAVAILGMASVLAVHAALVGAPPRRLTSGR